MNRMIFGTVALFLCLGTTSAQDAAPSYTKDIRPLLNKYCVECHKAANPKGGLNLESFDSIMKGGKKGRKVLVAGKPDESRLVTTTEGTVKPAMPPKNAKKKPTADEIAMLRDWVKAGAKDDTPANARLEPNPIVEILATKPTPKPAGKISSPRVIP